jgi:putative endopeptidase
MKTSKDSNLRCPIKPSIPLPFTTRQPGNGFYQYVNGYWLQANHVEPWRSEYSVSDEVEEETDKTLLNSINALPELNLSSQTNLSPKTAEDHLRLFRFIWDHSDSASEEEFLRICLQELMEDITSADRARSLGWMCRSRVPTVLQISVEEESHPPYFVRASLSSGGLLLPDAYYLDSNLQNSEIWKAYISFVSTCSIELGLPFLIKAIEAESQIAKMMDMSFNDRVVTRKAKSLKRWLPKFEWTAFMEGLHIDIQWQHRIWILNSSEKLKKIITWISTANDEYVIAILALHLISFSAAYLRKPIRDAADALFGRALKGTQHSPPKNKQLLSAMKDIIPSPLCTFYSKQEHTPNIINDVHKLVSKLQEASITIMKETRIFSMKTRINTQEKLHRMKFEIGKGPTNPLPDVTYTPDSVIHTILTILSQTSRMILKSTGHPSHSKDGIYPCFQVNASYYPESNHIVLPWGILQWPFYCANAPLGWNYGGLGATIGHEMTHAFDMEGSMYSPRAVMKESWTRKNRETFGKQTRKVSKFFGKIKHYGKKLNGTRTLSENWADLGGLKISLEALKSELDSLGATVATRKNAYRNFFMAYATSWRTLVRKEKLLYAMMTSVHAPAEDRVDRMVPQFQEWVDAFDVKETDALFIPLKHRLQFF